MNRNTELHFTNTPQIQLKRSKFEESHSHKTTFNVGDIIPVYVDSDILPGDTVQMDMAELIRMATPIYPIMDNLYADIYWFFVPHRLVWEDWAKFWGENDDPWTNNGDWAIPQIEAPEGGWIEGTIADYMGIPTKVDGFSVNALPFRAMAHTFNDWFRDENLKKNCHIYKDDVNRVGQNGTEQDYTYVTGVELGGLPPKSAKMHDYFTSALPEPQKGPAVNIPSVTGLAPIQKDITNLYLSAQPDAGMIPVNAYLHAHNTTGSEPLMWESAGGTLGAATRALGIDNSTGSQDQHITYNVSGTYNKGAASFYPSNLYTEADHKLSVTSPITDDILSHLYADMAASTAVSINQLRTAFAIQKYYENAGLHGTRYIEFIRGVFGVTSSDARMQRAEYLGGQRIPINIDQIIQTSSTDQTSPQGNTAGFSCTINRSNMFTKSFEEHGTLLCLLTIRTEHTYQQGLKRMWTRKRWTDFYNPFFANLGNTAITNKELYLQGEGEVNPETNTPYDDEAFGYQEAWADYRYKENFVSGYMRSNATGSLDVWHFADDYEAMPRLSSEWIDEPYENVDRTIAVTSQLTHQFIADFFFKCYYTRPMPVYSIPGLIDHV